MKPAVVRLPAWVPFERPWMVIFHASIGWFPSWETAYQHATRIAA